MSADVVAECRRIAALWHEKRDCHPPAAVGCLEYAADEIERLRARVAELEAALHGLLLLYEEGLNDFDDERYQCALTCDPQACAPDVPTPVAMGRHEGQLEP